jgi:hypothetical protein
MRKCDPWSLFYIGELFSLLLMEPIAYSVKYFVLNESFQKWILEPDVKANVFWEEWLSEHPDKIELIKEARSTIQSIRETHEKKLTRERDQVWDMITESILKLDSDEIIKTIGEIENTR